MANINDVLSDVNSSLSDLETAVNNNLSTASNAQKIKGFPVADLSAMPDGAIFRYNATSGEIEPLEGLGDFSGAQDGDLLKWNATNGRFEVATPADISFAMEDLSNTPDVLGGNANKILVLDNSETTFQFRSFPGLSLANFEVKQQDKIIDPYRLVHYEGADEYKSTPLLPHFSSYGIQDQELQDLKAKVTTTSLSSINAKYLNTTSKHPVKLLDRTTKYIFGSTAIDNNASAVYWQYTFDTLQTVGTFEFFPMEYKTKFKYRFVEFDIITIDDTGTETVQKTVSLGSNNNPIVKTVELSAPVSGVRSIKIEMNSLPYGVYNRTPGIQVFPEINIGSQEVQEKKYLRTELKQGNLGSFFIRGSNLYLISGSLKDPSPYRVNVYSWDETLSKWEFLYTTPKITETPKGIYSEVGNFYFNFSKSGELFNGVYEKSSQYISGDIIAVENEIYDFVSGSSSRIKAINWKAFGAVHSPADEKLFNSRSENEITVVDFPNEDLNQSSQIKSVLPYDIPELEDKLGQPDLHQSNRELYLPAKSQGLILVISTVDESLITTISVGSNPHTVKIDVDKDIGVSIEEFTLTVFSLSTKSVLNQINISTPTTNLSPGLTEVVFHGSKEEMIVLLNSRREIQLYSTNTFSEIGKTKLNESPERGVYFADRFFITTSEGSVIQIGEI